jgi:hypothetical protein
MELRGFSAVLAAAGLALAASSVATHASNIVYQSVPSLTATPDTAWCSDCNNGFGPFEPLDQFTLTRAAHITGLQLVTYDFASDGYNGLVPFTFEVYNSDHSAIIFSEAIAPTLLAAVPPYYDLVESSVTGLNLAAGTYWAGFYAPKYALGAYYTGGNGSLIETTPHTGEYLSSLGGNLGYALLAPEPSTWAKMLVGFAGLGGLALGRRRQAASTAI